MGRQSPHFDIMLVSRLILVLGHYDFFTLLFSNLADAFIQSDLQIRKSNYNYKLKPYKYYIHTFKKIKKLNQMTNAYNIISKLNV